MFYKNFSHQINPCCIFLNTLCVFVPKMGTKPQKYVVSQLPNRVDLCILAMAASNIRI